MSDSHATSGQRDGPALSDLAAPGAGDGAAMRDRCAALGIDWLEQPPPADRDAISLITADAAVRLVHACQPDYFSFADWQRIDEQEVAKGQAQGRPRVKFIYAEEMLAALGRT